MAHKAFSVRNEIPEVNMPRLTELLEKLNKRAEVVGTSPIAMTVHSTEVREWDKETGEMMMWFDVEVKGQVPVLTGWELVAVIDHENPDGNMLRRFPFAPEDVEVPERYRTADPDCDHCGYQRIRNETFLLNKDGEYKQVGRNCLKDFGANEGQLRKIEFMDRVYEQVSEAAQWDISPGSGGQTYFDLVEFLTTVACVIENRGWLSRGKARDQGRLHHATADIAADVLFTNKKDDDILEVQPTAEHEETALAALDWVRDFERSDELSDYEWNLMIACQQDHARYKDTGIVASLIPAYYRGTGQWSYDEDRRLDKDEQPTSEWVGKVGDRQTFDLTIQMAKPIDGYYGKSTLYLMTDADGNVYKWFTTANPVKRKMYLEFVNHPNADEVHWLEEFEMEVGWTYRIKGTIKDHDEFNGVKQTDLSRCSVQEILEKPEEEREAA